MVAEGPCHVAAPGNSMSLLVLTFVCCSGIASLLYVLYHWSLELRQPWSRAGSARPRLAGHFHSAESDKRDLNPVWDPTPVGAAAPQREPVAGYRPDFIHPVANLWRGFGRSNPRARDSKG